MKFDSILSNSNFGDKFSYLVFFEFYSSLSICAENNFYAWFYTLGKMRRTVFRSGNEHKVLQSSLLFGFLFPGELDTGAALPSALPPYPMRFLPPIPFLSR